MREIVLDTETTGFDPLGGHRIVEIGAVELIDHSLTDQVFHSYFNPERAMLADAIAVHGLTAALLADKPLFGAIADELLAFVGDAPLVAHNAGFDVAFLNAELKRAGKPPIAPERVVDTLVLARRKHPGGHNTLDDLCSRYSVDRSHRTQHGALLDAELLAAVYIELTTTRQAALQLESIRLEPSNLDPRQLLGCGLIRCRRGRARTIATRTGRSWRRSAPTRFGLTTLRSRALAPPDMLLPLRVPRWLRAKKLLHQRAYRPSLLPFLLR
jgi:DNA polymerase III subunit epsilon